MTVQVKSVDRQVLHDFWKRFYFPGNATLYVVGDFDAGGGMDAAEQLIRDTFGKIPAGQQPGSGAPGPLRQQHMVWNLIFCFVSRLSHCYCQQPSLLVLCF